MKKGEEKVISPEISDQEGFIVENPQMKFIVKKARIIAPLNVPVLITGETGVGKEELARFIHRMSQRTSEFVLVNSAGLPDTLIESELFGYRKGAFSGAVSDRIGFIQLAHKGTLFLDEIGDLSLVAQAKILQVIDDRNFSGQRQYYPVGGREKVEVDFRLISASNQPLEELIAEKKFRKDLFYRLNVVSFCIPPLRERPEDICALTFHFVKAVSEEFGKPLVSLSKRAWSLFLEYDWPGNVRQLKNVILRAILMNGKETVLNLDKENFGTLFEKDEEVEIEKKENESVALIVSDKLEDFDLAILEKEHLIAALDEHGWNKNWTADFLGISRFILSHKIDKYQIEPASGNWGQKRRRGKISGQD